MKAVICTGYGPPDVLQLQDAAKPVPKSGDVCVNIIATAVTASDCIVRGFKLPPWHPLGFLMGVVVGFGKPRQSILGMVLAGDVEAVGADAARFQVGDAVYAFTGTRFGCYAEYTCLPERPTTRLPATVPAIIALKPANLTYEEAAAVPYGGLIALHFLKKGHIERRHKVLIYGASGAIGTAAVQLAGYFGATVTGVCSTRNIDLVKSLGVDKVIDYTSSDAVHALERYDLVLDAVGKRKSSALKEHAQNALMTGGAYISIDDGRPQYHDDGLELLTTLVTAGRLKPVIDHRYPLEEVVAAHHYVETGRKRGNVVITVN